MIIDAVNESVNVRKCSGSSGCTEDGTQCLTHSLWAQLSDRISTFLDNITLEELMHSEHVQNISEIQNIKYKQTAHLHVKSH
jgi:Rrf2 family iron-sulfur cluster assembly transcriptional regulator